MSEARPRGRPRRYDPDRAMDAAVGAFLAAGFSGTSLDRLSEATGMNRPSLYGAFGDKEALYLKALAHYAARLDAPANFHFHPVGIWSEDTELTFFAPADSRETSHSVYDLHGTGGGFQARCLTLASMMRECGHDRIDLLKLDVEGAWREVLGHVLEQPTLPIVMAIEFDSPTSLPLVVRWIDRLKARGLHLAHMEKENFVFIDFERLGARSSQAAGAAA